MCTLYGVASWPRCQLEMSKATERGTVRGKRENFNYCNKALRARSVDNKGRFDIEPSRSKPTKSILVRHRLSTLTITRFSASGIHKLKSGTGGNTLTFANISFLCGSNSDMKIACFSINELTQ